MTCLKEIITWNDIIITNIKKYLKPYNWVQTIFIWLEYIVV